MKTPELLVMAVSPETLTARLGAGSAAPAVAELLVRSTVELVASYWPGEVSLCIAPGPPFALYRRLAGEFHLRLTGQAGGAPAQAVHAALAEGIARRGAAAVLDGAVPHLPGAVLEEAFEQLARGRHVLGPADGGGCYLLGLPASRPALFEGLDWDGPSTAEALFARGRAAGIEFEALPLERIIRGWDDLYPASRRLDALQDYV